jgi:hypothetical protein
VANPEAELAEHYARILGQRADRQVSDVIRTCLRRLPSRLPIHGEDLRAVEELIERVLRLGEVGARDPVGSPRQIDDYIARRLGEPASGPRSVYRALRAMLGHTVLVERHSRQIWVLRLFGLTDSSSKLHRALLTETPAQFSLPAPDMDTAVGSATAPPPSTPVEADPSHQRDIELAELREALAVERLARVEADNRRAAADAELGTLRGALDEERRARGEADQRAQVAAAQLSALERELGRLRRALDEERRAREEADRRGLAGAAERTEIERELRRVLDEERRARSEVGQRIQVVSTQLIELKQKHLDALRDHQVELETMRTEIDRCIRDARAADAATVWRLIENNQAQEALAFIAARMDGHDVEEVSKSPPPSRSSDPPAGPAAVLVEIPRRAPAVPTAAGPSPQFESPLPPAASSNRPPDTSAPDATRRTEPPVSSRSSPRTQPLTSPVLAAHTEPGQPRQGPPVKPNKVGRNEPCPCGSGNKYKRCCGRLA